MFANTPPVTSLLLDIVEVLLANDWDPHAREPDMRDLNCENEIAASGIVPQSGSNKAIEAVAVSETRWGARTKSSQDGRI